jgi:hypothetical protein
MKRGMERIEEKDMDKEKRKRRIQLVIGYAVL